MITPSFGLTATERVLPKLALDFTTASLDSRITFTRTTGASNPATYVNSSGLVTAATDNQPRFDYDPVTLACKGLLIEESRTNIILRSNEFGNASWSKVGGGTGVVPVVTPNAAVSPDGTMNAAQVVFNKGAGTTSSDYSIMQQGTSAITGLGSIYVKADTPVRLMMRVGATWLTIDATTSWKRVNTVSESAGSIQIGLRAGYGISSLPDTATVYLYGAQLEAGAFATSYIPTTTAALTRNADVATMTGTNFSDWYTAGTGAFNCAVLPKSATGTKPVLQFDDATALNTIAMHGNATSVELKITTLSVLQSTLSTGTITANTAYGSCGAWTAGSNALSKSGGVAITGSPVSIPTVTQSRLGSDGTNYFNGWLQKINYWPQRLTNSEVQAFSK